MQGKVRSQIENKSDFAMITTYCCFVHTHVFRIDGEAGENGIGTQHLIIKKRLVYFFYILFYI